MTLRHERAKMSEMDGASDERDIDADAYAMARDESVR